MSHLLVAVVELPDALLQDLHLALEVLGPVSELLACQVVSIGINAPFRATFPRFPY